MVLWECQTEHYKTKPLQQNSQFPSDILMQRQNAEDRSKDKSRPHTAFKPAQPLLPANLPDSIPLPQASLVCLPIPSIKPQDSPHHTSPHQSKLHQTLSLNPSLHTLLTSNKSFSPHFPTHSKTKYFLQHTQQSQLTPPELPQTIPLSPPPFSPLLIPLSPHTLKSLTKPDHLISSHH